jgi:hypothetical protein
MVAVWTTVGVLSVVLPATASVVLIIGGTVMQRAHSPGRRRAGVAVLFLGLLGLVSSAAWLVLALYVEANVR